MAPPREWLRPLHPHAPGSARRPGPGALPVTVAREEVQRGRGVFLPFVFETQRVYKTVAEGHCSSLSPRSCPPQPAP